MRLFLTQLWATLNLSTLNKFFTGGASLSEAAPSKPRPAATRKWVQRCLPAAVAVTLTLAGCTTPQNPARAPRATVPSGKVGGTVARPSAGNLPPVATTELSSNPVTPLAAPADLWERIRRGFGMPDLPGERVEKWQTWYLSHPDYLERMADRSRLYIFHVVEALELRGMPTELALLPYIESAFNPLAVSNARAAGMWQFMPATGSTYELRQNMLRDDRRDVIASTRAALDYLQKLYDQFGDWQLALAAYNWGEGNVARAIEKNRAAGLPTDYEHLSMPAETRNYLPKLQAVKNIIAHPETHGVDLPMIENHPFFDTVDIRQDIDVSMAARLAQVRLEDFKALNPSQRKPIIFAAGTPQILLPWDNAAIFKENLAKQPSGTLASWTPWIAPSTLAPAKAAQMVGMSEADLRAINNIPRGMLVKSGSTLLVRRKDGTPDAAPQEQVNNARLALAPATVLKRVTVRARSGDTIARVAARYDLPAATVAGWNDKSAATPLTRWQPVTLYLPMRAGRASAARSHTDQRHRGKAVNASKTGRAAKKKKR